MRKVCFITGTRAEYGLLSRLMRLVKDSAECELQIIATNMHLMPEYGNTYKEIEADGFCINERVPMPKPSDNAQGVLASMATELTGMGEALQRLSPDIVVILGDRYEMHIAATACMMMRIPIAHLHGGEVSEGAIDDSIRHCITKMSALHFTSTDEYRERVIQLGEEPERVFNVGALGVENLRMVPLLSKEELEQSLDFELDKNTVLCTYHPVTLGDRTAAEEIDELMQAFSQFPTLRVLFTMPNSDQGGDAIREAIQRCCEANPRCKAFNNLGMQRYLSAMQYVAAVVGNSSSGLLEAPSAHIPSVNIGSRQDGRVRSKSVIDCDTNVASIANALRTALSPTFQKCCRTIVSPYEKPGTAQAIYQVLATFPMELLRRKRFFNLYDALETLQL